MISFQELSGSNRADMIYLLEQRNKTLSDYTDWKYNNVTQQASGIIAYDGHEPVGCFGLLLRTLKTHEETLKCGWFADWYVIPTARASGLGSRLISTLGELTPVIFGHPAPTQAQKSVQITGIYRFRFNPEEG